MKKHLLLSILIFLFALSANAQGLSKSQVSTEKRQKWIDETVVKLKEFRVDSTVTIAQMYQMDYGDSVRLGAYVSGNMLIKTKGKGWIYVMPHSEHQDKSIGDIAVAIDNKKRIYFNEGHICGGSVVYQAFHFKELIKTDDFFKYFTNTAGGDGRWQRIK